MKNSALVIILFFSVFSAVAQQGSPLLTHFTESREIENQSWAICQDDNNVMLFANRKGILSFDGQEWQVSKLSAIPYTMQKNISDGKIYIGGENGFGCLEKDHTGSYKYNSLLTDSVQTGIITRIIFKDTIAWLYSDQIVCRFNLQTRRPGLFLPAGREFPFTGMFINSGKAFINVMGKGLFRVDGDSLFPIVTGYLTENKDVLFALPYNEAMVLLGLSDGTLTLFDGIKYYDFKISDDGYLKGNSLSEGIVLGDTAYAFSTLEGGSLVVEKSTGKVLFTINNQNGLPDDEVFAIGSDNSGGLWLSHQSGLTRADLGIPVSNMSVFPGLKGNLTYAMRHNRELYVATSEGVFYLAQVKNYSTEEVLVKNVNSAPVPSPPYVSSDVHHQGSNRKNTIRRIFGGRIFEQRSPEPEPEVPVKKLSQPADKYTRRKVSRLKSVNHTYKKIEGLNEKCRQLVSTPHGILAATNKGLYVIKEHKAILVIPERYIHFISWQPLNGKYFIATGNGYYSVTNTDNTWVSDLPDPKFSGSLYSIFQEGENSLWMGGDNIAYKADFKSGKDSIIYSSYKLNNEFPDHYILKLINDTVSIFTESGIHFYNKTSDTFIPYNIPTDRGQENLSYSFPVSNISLVRYNNEWYAPGSGTEIEDRELAILKIFDNLVSVQVDNNNLWIIDDNTKLYNIDRTKTSGFKSDIEVFIKGISNERGIALNLQNLKFDRGDNVINFNIVAPGYLKQNTTRYQYFIDEQMSEWSDWSVNTSYVVSIARPGDYVLSIRAKDVWGNISQPQSVTFTVKPPFTRTLLFYLLTGVLLLGIIITIIRFRERQLVNKNRILEQKVRERTAEIEARKEEITASIAYASRIQRAMLPMEALFRESFSDYFIFFKPRDMVSGDFYWIGEDSKSIFFTVADCTGHGVPGAFMSTMGISTLNEIIANNQNLKANTVLDLLREKTKRSLHQTGKEGEATDGMDIAFCVLDKKKNILQYAGAYNPLFISQKGEIKEYKADRMPIGIHYGEESAFTNYVINLTKGDTIYLFSDGFTDQFGGPEGEKYKKSNLKKLLSEIYYRPMVEQRNILEAELEKWKGDADQIDDITIIGVRI